MDNYKHLKNILHHIINDMDDSRSLFCVNPDTDFIRSRILDFKTTITSIICMENGSLKDELFKFFDDPLSVPTSSAFVQSRIKIKMEAFLHIFNTFNSKTYDEKLFKGYRLLAVDGSELPIDNTFQDNDTTIRNCNQFNKSYSAFHLNASYDLLECTYDDLLYKVRLKWMKTMPSVKSLIVIKIIKQSLSLTENLNLTMVLNML